MSAYGSLQPICVPIFYLRGNDRFQVCEERGFTGVRGERLERRVSVTSVAAVKTHSSATGLLVCHVNVRITVRLTARKEERQ